MSAEEQHYCSLAKCDLDNRLMADINSHSETEEDEEPFFLTNADQLPAWCPIKKEKSKPLSKDASLPIVSSISEKSQNLERDPSLRGHFKQKIYQLSAQLQLEKAKRDENTIEYLQLLAKADLQQAARARVVFEKRDQQRSATIGLLQRRLQVCQTTLLELDLHHLKKNLNNLHMEREYKLDELQESHHQASLQDKYFHVDPNQESLQENTFGEQSTDSTSDKDVKLQEMAHQSYESTKDIWEVMESFKCRISKLEVKCNRQVEVDMKETLNELQSDGSFMDLVLTIGAFLFVCLCLVCVCARPLINICMCTMGTIALGVGLVFILQNWDAIIHTIWKLVIFLNTIPLKPS